MGLYVAHSTSSLCLRGLNHEIVKLYTYADDIKLVRRKYLPHTLISQKFFHKLANKLLRKNILIK